MGNLGGQGVPPESAQGTPDATSDFSSIFEGPRSHWVPYGHLQRRLDAPVGAKGHKKAGSGSHSVSNAVNSATVDNPGVALRHESIINNMVFAKATLPLISSKRVAQGGPKRAFGVPVGTFGRRGAHCGAFWARLMHFQARSWSQPPKRESAAGAAHLWE